MDCFYQQPGLIQPIKNDCQAAIDLIPPGLVFDPHSPGTSDRFNLTVPETYQRWYKLPSAFISGSCSITVKFDDAGISSSELYFHFWPSVRGLAKQVVNNCVANHPPNTVWGGYGTGIYRYFEPGGLTRGWLVNVKGWNLNIYTPNGELEP